MTIRCSCKAEVKCYLVDIEVLYNGIKCCIEIIKQINHLFEIKENISANMKIVFALEKLTH